MRLSLLCIALSFGLGACDSADDRFFAQTRVEGIVVADEQGNALAGTGETRDDWDLRPGSVAGVGISRVGPNPVSDRAAFFSSVPTAQQVRAVLVDRRYREVAVLFDVAVEPGGRPVAFERPEGLPAGVYRMVVEGEGWGTYGDVEFLDVELL